MQFPIAAASARSPEPPTGVYGNLPGRDRTPRGYADYAVASSFGSGYTLASSEKEASRGLSGRRRSQRTDSRPSLPRNGRSVGSRCGRGPRRGPDSHPGGNQAFHDAGKPAECLGWPATRNSAGTARSSRRAELRLCHRGSISAPGLHSDTASGSVLSHASITPPPLAVHRRGLGRRGIRRRHYPHRPHGSLCCPSL